MKMDLSTWGTSAMTFFRKRLKTVIMETITAIVGEDPFMYVRAQLVCGQRHAQSCAK